MKGNIKLNPIYIKSEENVVADALSWVPIIKSVDTLEALVAPYQLCCHDVLSEIFSSRSVGPRFQGKILPH